MSGLVSYWDLNEPAGSTVAADAVVGDMIDGNNPGAYFGSGITVGDAGPRPSDGWLGFEENNRAATFIKLPDARLQMASVAGYGGLSDVTMLAWVRVTDPDADLLVNTLGGLQATGFPRSVLGVDNAPTGLRGFVRRAADDQILLGPTTVGSLANWHFVAVSYAGGTTGRLYWDGVEIATTQRATAQGLDAATAMVFGQDIGDPTRSLHGQIDELAMFNRALGAAEIQSLFTAAQTEAPYVPGSTATADYYETAVQLGGLRNHWRFSETSGAAATDSIGGNDGTFVNVAGAPVTLGLAGPTPSEGHDGYAFKGFAADNTSVKFVWNTGANYMQSENGQGIGDPATGRRFVDGVSQLTMSMWYKNVFNGEGYLGGFSKSGTSNRYVFSVYSPTATTLRFYAMSNNGVQLVTDDITMESAGDHQWHHVVQVWDGTERRLRVYIDGQERFNGVDASMTANLYVPGGFFLGRDVYGSNRNLGGFLDEVSLFDRALSAEEVFELYDSAFFDFLVPGDATRDGIVDQDDAERLAENWGATTLNASYSAWWEMGDFNRDHVVNAADAAILNANWGYGVGESTADVPEPATVVLLLCGCVGAAVRRVRGLESRREAPTIRLFRKETG